MALPENFECPVCNQIVKKEGHGDSCPIPSLCASALQSRKWEKKSKTKDK